MSFFYCTVKISKPTTRGAGLLDQKKIRPKKKESVKINQMRGSISGCDILTKLEELEKKKEEKIKQRDAKAQSLVDLRKKFDLCKDAWKWMSYERLQAMSSVFCS